MTRPDLRARHDLGLGEDESGEGVVEDVDAVRREGHARLAEHVRLQPVQRRGLLGAEVDRGQRPGPPSAPGTFCVSLYVVPSAPDIARSRSPGPGR